MSLKCWQNWSEYLHGGECPHCKDYLDHCPYCHRDKSTRKGVPAPMRCDCPLGWGALAAAFLCGCAGQYVPPVSVSAGFFGATVTVSEPGFTVPARVVQTPAVTTPTLMVPLTAPVMSGAIVPVTNAAGQQVSVPVVADPSVNVPILAVPTK